MGFENCANRWSEEEENFVLVNIDYYKGVIQNLPLSAMAKKLDRSEGAIKIKALRLLEKQKKQADYDWTRQERREVFELHVKGIPYAEITKKLRETGSDFSTYNLRAELSRLKKAWEDNIRVYAEERGLPVAKKLNLDTIAFYIENRDTTSDFVRKGLHSRIKNG